MKKCSTSSSRKNLIPIFYACDDNFIKYTVVSIKSLIENSNKANDYMIYILNAGISEDIKKEVYKLATDNVFIEFVCVREQLESIGKNLPIRDYYSKTTYFRLFIAEMFPQYDKAIYIDSDTIVLGDISQFYNRNLENNLVGACQEQVMVQTEVFGNYVGKVMGINRNKYFNAGHLLINCTAFRKEKIFNKFLKLLNIYTFVVTQDEDYLNVLCKDRVLWIEQGWNVEVYNNIPVAENQIKMLHYIMVSKPWHYYDCRLKEYFWKYAEKTDVYQSIINELESYTDEQRAKDLESCKRLEQTAIKESERIDTYVNLISNMDGERLKVLEKIRTYELNGKFDVDVENDPETVTLLPDKVDYLAEKCSTRFFTKIANKKAVQFYEKAIKNGTFVIKSVNGIENFRQVSGGAMITCNHFSAYDNYVVYRALRDELPKGKFLYKVIREGNYTSFKGLFGFFFKHCNTLPLSSNTETMKKFMRSISVLLNRGEKILIYPEQAMWWNYRKPRPLKSGAFKFAVKNNVPVIPTFITMEDTEKTDKNGFPIQAHTIWFLPAIYPKAELNERENVEYMKNENFRVWKNLYERVYGVELKYSKDKLCYI